MKLNQELLDGLVAQAKESPRLRAHYNLHETLDAKAQRLFIALEPGTMLPIHRHRATQETQIVIKGRIRVFFYHPDKTVKESFDVACGTDTFGVQIPKGEWHNLEVLEPDTVILEVKDGPYIPSAPEDLL